MNARYRKVTSLEDFIMQAGALVISVLQLPRITVCCKPVMQSAYNLTDGCGSRYYERTVIRFGRTQMRCHKRPPEPKHTVKPTKNCYKVWQRKRVEALNQICLTRLLARNFSKLHLKIFKRRWTVVFIARAIAHCFCLHAVMLRFYFLVFLSRCFCDNKSFHLMFHQGCRLTAVQS